MTSTDLVLRHYFKPKGTDVAGDLEAALPAVLTTRPRPLPAAALSAGAPNEDPLVDIATKLNALTPAQRAGLVTMLNT